MQNSHNSINGTMRFALGSLLTLIWMPNVNAEDGTSKPKGKNIPAYVTAQHEKPRVRNVHVNKVMVRCGPSDSNYVTMSLPKGANVDVYLETSDGWSGIRPPSGSHNWIPAGVAYLLPGGKTAEVIEEDTPAWIGSELSDVTDFQWQVSLKASQQVLVLGEEEQLDENGEKKLWYRIAPPQGEFRWVKTSQLSDQAVSVQPEAIASVPKDHKPNRIVKPNPAVKQTTDSKPSEVELASYQQIQEPVGEEIDAEPGTIVWSNEREILANVEKQIRSEQAEVQQELATKGIPIQSMPNNAKGAKPSTGTKIRPIPNKAKSKQTLLNPDQQHWDAMKASEAQTGNESKLRVGPLNSVLGLVGISVIEADRAPIQSQIMRNARTEGNGNLGQMGAVGTNRLDRLPRPGRRTPGMTLPSGTPIDFAGASESDTYGYSTPLVTPRMTGQSNGTVAESTFSKWMNAREPLFGSQGNSYAQIPPPATTFYPGPQPSPTPYPPQPFAPSPSVSSLAGNNSSWHGIPRSGMNDPRISSRTELAREPENEVDDFQTAEIQSALVSLNQEVASPTESWNLGPIRNQAASWIENGATAMVRGEARLLLERVERFESLRQRTLGLVQDTSMMAQQAINQRAAALASSAPLGTGVIQASANQPIAPQTTMASNQAMNQEGDASGWLVQVHTSNPGQPEFALTDDAGNVIAYVQSTASLNLRRYLQQPVTIHGMRGYLPGLAAKQIVAERVVRVR